MNRHSDFFPPERIGGVLTAAIGFVALCVSSSYGAGDPARIGPGVFPALAAVALLVTGLGLSLSGTARTQRVAGMPRLLPVAVPVVSSLLVFAALIRSAGFVPAMSAAMLLASLANGRLCLRHLVLAVAAPAAGAAVFVYGLGLGVPVFPW